MKSADKRNAILHRVSVIFLLLIICKLTQINIHKVSLIVKM